MWTWPTIQNDLGLSLTADRQLCIHIQTWEKEDNIEIKMTRFAYRINIMKKKKLTSFYLSVCFSYCWILFQILFTYIMKKSFFFLNDNKFYWNLVYLNLISGRLFVNSNIFLRYNLVSPLFFFCFGLLTPPQKKNKPQSKLYLGPHSTSIRNKTLT